MARIAIIGTGIAGLGCAHFLQRDFDLTVYEQNNYAGGHSNTVTVREPGTGRDLPVDTGFMVFNRVTYPSLCRLFAELAVPVQPTDMSFSVHDRTSGLEWCGSSLNHLFAQRRNLLNLRFLRMLAQVHRFNREALEALAEPQLPAETLESYVRRRGYGRDFLELYLLPMSSAVWSSPPADMLGFPALTLLRFFHNHGFLGLDTQHPWLTVTGGAREYVRRLTEPWRHRIQLVRAAVRVERQRRTVVVHTAGGLAERFDHVILATHADQALRLLAPPTSAEQRVLGTFTYQPNLATLHTDTNVMPRTRRAWASWNYSLVREGDGQLAPATHYWMNRLQGVSEREQYFVTLGGAHAIDPARVLRRINYEHPRFTLDAVRAQPELPELNAAAAGSTETYFAGSYFRYGFHEDALHSAVQLCAQLLQRDPWTGPADRPAAESESAATAALSA